MAPANDTSQRRAILRCMNTGNYGRSFGGGQFVPEGLGVEVWPTHSHALVVEHRPEGTCHLHKFLLSPQHGADVFVCGGSLVTKPLREAGGVPDSPPLPAGVPF